MSKNKNIIQSSNILFVLLLIIITVSVESGNTTYIQFMTDIIGKLDINSEDANYLIRLNIVGIFISSCFIGPLSDIYGRRKPFILGLILYVISSITCYYLLNNNFVALVFFRFIQGISEGIITIIVWLIILDRFSVVQSGKIAGFSEGSSYFILAILPLFTLWIAKIYYWRVAFVIIPVLSVISLLLALVSLKKEETEENKPFNLQVFKKIFKDYWKLLKNFECTTYIFIYAFATASYVVIYSNISIVFVHNDYINKEVFSYFMIADSMLYVLASFLSIYIIAKKGIDFTKNFGFIIFMFGCLGLFAASCIDRHNIYLILTFILIISFGSALVTGFMLKATEMLPKMKGSILSLSYVIISAISARKIYWTQVLFDNTIMPTSTVIFIGASILTVLFALVCYKKYKISQ